MLKGGLTVDTSGTAHLYFQSNNTAVEIWVDSISLQPFSEKTHQDQSIEKNRKAKVRIQAVDKQGNPLPHANISIIQKKVNFPFGCAINKNILNNPAYQAWFTSRFTVTVFENELKWLRKNRLLSLRCPSSVRQAEQHSSSQPQRYMERS